MNPICADLNNACSLNSNSLSGSNFLCSWKKKKKRKRENPLNAKIKVCAQVRAETGETGVLNKGDNEG